jgi:uncharacterized protein
LFLKRLPYFLCFILISWQIPVLQKGTYVNDYTGHLDASEVFQLNQSIAQLEKETDIQLAIIIINDLPENISLEDYARRTGNEWKVGNHFNGLVYVAVLNAHKQRLEVAKNLEGDIPDITAFQIIESLKAELRADNYFAAMNLLVDQVSEKLGHPRGQKTNSTDSVYVPVEGDTYVSPYGDYEKDNEFEKQHARYNSWRGPASYMLFIGAIGFCIWAFRYRKRYIAENTVDGVYMGAGSSYYSDGSDGYGGSDSGSGFGGFGGDGGGGFSGGGASGDW